MLGTEIERKFLVRTKSYSKTDGVSYRQGYLPTEKATTVRIRTAGNQGYITIKGATVGLSRKEYEYPISVEDANEMLSTLCTGHLIDKVRYRVEHEGLMWEVDEFKAENEGLVVAEVELSREDQLITLPPWVGNEVSTDSRYTNFALSRRPFSLWEK